MKKIIGFISLIAAAFVAIILASCQMSYSASSIKSSLENSGYTVSEQSDLVFEDDNGQEVKASKLTGIQKIYTAVKGSEDDKEFSIILIFDSIGNSDAGINDSRLVTIGQAAEKRIGENKVSTFTIGRFNNVCFAGTSTCKEAAGLR